MVTVGRPYQKVDPGSESNNWRWDLEKKPAFILMLGGLIGLGIGYGLDRWIANMEVHPWHYLGWSVLCLISGTFLWFSPVARKYQRQVSSSILVFGYLSLILLGFINHLPPVAVALISGAQLLLALSFLHWVEYALFALISLGVFLFCSLSLPQLQVEVPVFMGLVTTSTLVGGLFTWWRVGRLDPETPADELISHLLDQDEDALFLLNYEGDRIVFQNYAASQLMLRLGATTDIDGKELLAYFDLTPAYLMEHMPATPPGHPEKQYFQKEDARGQDLRLELMLSKLPMPEMPYFRLKISDITRRVHREYSVRRSLAIHQSLMHAMPDLIISLDSKDKILTLHAPRLMRDRVKLNTFEGQPLQRLIQTFLSEENQLKVKNHVSEARRSNTFQQVEFDFEFQGETLHFELRLMRMQEGNELLGIMRDVTHKRRSALALQQSEDNYQTVFNSTKGGMIILDPDTFRPVDVNSKAADLLGYEGDSLLSKSVLDLIPDEEFSSFTSHLASAIDRSPTFVNTHLISQQGEILEVEMEIKQSQMDGQERVIIVFDDIKEQADSRKALVESEQRYRALVENMNEGLILTDSQERILFVNQRMTEVLGLSEGELIGKTTYQVLGQGTNVALIQEKTLLRQRGKSDEYELSFHRKDGQKVCLLISGSPYMDHEGKIIGSIAIITDITDRKKTEDQLEEKQKELDSFIYKASHDLRGPLASIIGIANLAKSEIKEEAAHRYMDLIGKSTKKLDLTLGELLDATRINDAIVKPEAVNLKQLIDETFESLQGIYDRDKIMLKSQIGHKSLINTDPHLLKSILQNLISNGINFANHQADKPFVQVNTRTTPDKLYIEVKDNGVGIPDRVQPKVFEMFYRGHNQSEGSGLGLYVVKNAAKKIGGEISFESAEGKGSTFILTLPLKIQEPISHLQN